MLFDSAQGWRNFAMPKVMKLYRLEKIEKWYPSCNNMDITPKRENFTSLHVQSRCLMLQGFAMLTLPTFLPAALPLPPPWGLARRVMSFRALRVLLCLALALSLSLGLAGCGLKGMGSVPPPSPKASQVMKTAYSQMGKRYRYGGDSPRKGFDCSGLIYWVYQKHGIKVPRITTDQAQAGYSVPKRQAAPGDIVVFRTSSAPRGLHTGIYAGNNTFIHSPKRGENVRMESMEIPYWKTKLTSVRRVIK